MVCSCTLRAAHQSEIVSDTSRTYIYLYICMKTIFNWKMPNKNRFVCCQHFKLNTLIWGFVHFFVSFFAENGINERKLWVVIEFNATNTMLSTILLPVMNDANRTSEFRKENFILRRLLLFMLLLLVIIA